MNSGNKVLATKLSDMFDIQCKSKYMIKLIDRYGLEIVKKREKELLFSWIKTRNDW